MWRSPKPRRERRPCSACQTCARVAPGALNGVPTYRQESNLRPRAPEARALSPELRALGTASVDERLREACSFGLPHFPAGRFRSTLDVPLADVASRYADLVESVFSTAIAGKAWLRDGRARTGDRPGAHGVADVGKASARRAAAVRDGRRVHRWSGRIALLLTLPVFFHCVTILGFQAPDARVAIHSIAGSFVYGVVAAKLLVIRHRSRNYAPWVCPCSAGRWPPSSDDALADVEPLVFHERPVRVLMRSPLKPVVLLLVVSAAVLALALWSRFRPRRLPRPPGRATATRCAARRSSRRAAPAATELDATGGVGPALRGSGLSAAEVSAVVASGRGAMPAGIVSGQDAADVAAHVASLGQ